MILNYDMNIFRNTALLLAVFVSATLSAQTDIQDLRSNYNIGDVVTITGIVTSGADLGSVRYIQDASAGIALYPGSDWTDWAAEPNPGDEVMITGEISEYNGLLEVGPNLTQVDVLSSGNPLPDAQVVTPNQLNESLEGEIVVIESTTFDAGGQTIESNTTYTFASGGEEGNIYVRSSNSLVGTILNGCEMNLMGIVSQFSFDGYGGYQLLPRGAADMQSTSGICLSSEVVQLNLTTTSFDLTWSTDVEGSSSIEWGLTSALGTTTTDPAMTTTHSLPLSGLAPGTLYYARAVSINAMGETVTSPTRVYATVSESSGNIHVYFTGSVDHTVATDEFAMSLGTSTNDTIAAWITSAQHTLEIAVYNTNNVAIENALNTAAANGVQIRYIAEGSNANLGIDDFDSSIAVHYRTDGEGSGMHNKFFVGDADYPETAFVLTGSTNMTTANLNTDKNNVIVFQDQSLARGYRLEFNEMWGSDGMVPDAAASKFGPDKTVNTPLKYIVGGSPVEVYFSPSDGTTSAIRKTIETMDYGMAFALLSFTRDDLADAIIDGSNFFVSPVGAIEEVGGTGAEFETLVDAGIDVHSHQGISGSLHHKYAVIDYSEPLSDPTVLTGSHNWSSTAENVNDENTVIVHDARVANLYYQEFRGLLISMGVIDAVEDVDGKIAITAYPNPTSDIIYVEVSQDHVGSEFTLRDISGREIARFLATTERVSLDLSQVEAGVYILSTQKLSSSLQIIVR
ncbi:MAG TPA: T9SS type A sorting domain-containing protein [Flavobacteriales bacterium]|nr:T9SS type A sorting domain-containing protein [Flavobacteriales bacterium]